VRIGYFADEGQGWKGFWPCSGRFEVVVLFGMLSLVAQFVYWSPMAKKVVRRAEVKGHRYGFRFQVCS
jgi:hypothetical protein